MKTLHFLLLPLFLLTFCTPVSQTSTSGTAVSVKKLQLEDRVYEKEIKTVRLHPAGASMAPAVTALGHWNLILEFDDLANDRDNYTLSIIHCNYNWTESGLQSLDFMREYNEISINNAQLSADTHIPYVHYVVPIPPVMLPGNYVAMVYRGTDKTDLILTRRFMVFNNQVSFSREGKLIGPGMIADLNQQINFTVNHSDIEILNPMMDVHVNLRQNQRWDNYMMDLKPSFVRDIEKELEYRFFDESKMFKGGNEFRFFDLRSLRNPGRNIDFVDTRTKPFEVFLARDKSRNGDAYAQYDEFNGNYVIENFDYRDVAYSQYAFVNFALTSRRVNGDVYVTGAFNDWKLDNTNKMSYDSVKTQYTSRILLKQGFYDYQYHVKSSTLPPYYFEGSHYETENSYEVFVYYRPFKPRADLLIGYLRLQENPR